MANKFIDQTGVGRLAKLVKEEIAASATTTENNAAAYTDEELTNTPELYHGTETPTTDRPYVWFEEVGESDPVKIAKLSQIETPKIVSSVDEMTDTSKHYVLDGYIYYNKEVVTPGETIKTYPNQFVPSTASLNSRLSGSSGSVSSGTNGYFVTDFIEVPNFSTVTPYIMRLNWEVPDVSDDRIVYYDVDKNRLGNVNITTTAGVNYEVSDGETIVSLKAAYANKPDESKVRYIKVALALTSSLAQLGSDDIADCEITLDTVYEEEIIEGGTTKEWVNSGITYAPTFQTDLIGVLGENYVIYISDNALPSGTYTLKANNENYDIIGTYTVE